VVTEFKGRIKGSGLDDGKRNQLQNIIQAYFREWLHSSGHIRHVSWKVQGLGKGGCPGLFIGKVSGPCVVVEWGKWVLLVVGHVVLLLLHVVLRKTWCARGQ
jgi:hypothetical protein